MGPHLDRSARVDALQERVDRLACRYPYAPAAELLRKTNRLRELLGALHETSGPSRQRDLLAAQGWATLLAACLEHDLGRPARSAALAAWARRLGASAGHSHIVAWSYEIVAWQAITVGRYADAARTCREATALAPVSNVAVQLKVQEAKALARMGMTGVALVALADAERLLDRLPAPSRPEHHFVVDRSKWAFYAAQVSDLAGDGRATLAFTQQCFIDCVAPDGSTRWPMRIAELQLGLAHLHLRTGALDTAVGYGLQALGQARHSAPSLLPRAIDLDTALHDRWPGESRTHRYRATLRQLQHRYVTLAPSSLAPSSLTPA
jgi:tetratricopeptide (TPR) repeat protein